MAEENKHEDATAAATKSSSDEGGITQNIFLAPECKTESVVVYLDRAEVCRSAKVSLKKGDNEVVIKELSSCIDKDSIRVEGKGPATISEVAFQTKHLTPEEKTQSDERSQDLKKQLEQAEQKESVLKAKETRLTRQRSLLDGFANNVTNLGNKDEKSGSQGPVLNSDMLQGMVGFFDLYDKQATRLDEQLHELSIELNLLREEISALRKNLAALDPHSKQKVARELSILLDAEEDAEVELFVSYVVNMAMWSPKYDIRVFSNDRKLKIQYYGMIQQSTGEDWNEAKLFLSTAMPSIGGTMPDLGTQKLAFKQRTSYFAKSAKRKPKGGWSFRRSKYAHLRVVSGMYSADAYEGEMNEESDDLSGTYPGARELPEMKMPTAEVKESITTTMYEIARPSTIPCDNVGHKVSVAIIDLQPTFEYESAPKRSSHAFLKARVKNTSPYALLAGPTNIFLDNNFIAKAELKAVSPSEDFTCSLGIDPAVKITYKPVHKFREQSGLLTKSTSMTFKQDIEVKNTHSEAIKILVSDQLPLSTEEKIKVVLHEPQIKHPEKYDLSKPIRLSKTNNVEWDLELPAGETKELLLKYTVEHPSNEEIESQVTHFNTSEA